MSTAFVTSAAELESVPDGTIISWLRIPGDPTSEAVAFVRHEDERVACAWAPVSGEPINWTESPVTWISPGGWDPMSVEDAGVTFPATVIRWGEAVEQPMLPPFDPSTIPVYAVPDMHGGTWSRETALRCAVELFKGDNLYVLPRNGDGPLLSPVMQVAEDFQAWLDRDALSEAINRGVITDEQARQAYATWLDRDAAADGDVNSGSDPDHAEWCCDNPFCACQSEGPEGGK